MGGEEAMVFKGVQALCVDNVVWCPHTRRWEAELSPYDVSKELMELDVNEFVIAVLMH